METINDDVSPPASARRVAGARPAPRITKFEPIPAAFARGRKAPFRMDLSELLTADEYREIGDAGSMSFHCIGDTGGVKNPEPQKLVEQGLEQSLHSGNMAPSLRGASMAPAFCYHLGDVIYYNGEVSEYFAQFYDPYEHYPLPIIGIPGNHDGEPINAQATSLEGFYRNFLALKAADGKPTFTPESRDSGRPAMSLPFFYWTLTTPFATFIGLYSNVPEHGRLDDQQRAWLHSEMAAADANKALIVAVHHPIYSFDDHQGGSPTMAKELQDAINVSRRVPNMVLNAHVHNYQRIEKTVGSHTIPFFLIGHGGYWNLHRLAAAQGYRDPETEAKLISAIDSRHGFMTFEISDSVINGNMTTVPRPQESWTEAAAYNASFDVFSYTSLPLHLAAGDTAVLLPPNGSNVPAHTDHGAGHPPAQSATARRRDQARDADATRMVQGAHGRRRGTSA